MSEKKAIITCALTGVLTDPMKHAVPVTPEEMAQSAKEAYDSGASIVHCHFRRQEPGMGRFPSWDPEVAGEIIDAIRTEVPELIINLSTGVAGPDISGPLSCLVRCKPEMAALNAGSLNYLRTRRDGNWAWPPMLFDNSVEKITSFIETMNEHNIIPECECFDTGIVRSVGLFQQTGVLKGTAHVSFVMGVASGMPAKADWLPLLIDELPENAHWQTIAIGREEIWDVHRRTAELGGHLRTGVEDTFYLPDGAKTDSNGALIAALADVARKAGREVASPAEAREILGLEG
jgi:3-keto-5-aminohexanoate cleavage enzyme